MSDVRHVNKIPTIRGTDIMRDPRLNKVGVKIDGDSLSLARLIDQPARLFFMSFTRGEMNLTFIMACS